ncbi:protein-tyrosine kinase (plasmid) [Lachnospira eligens]|uniref:Non-specific protein-tyrosine kinase n=1 Tax=Lachnospira eligens (strain ATCC 27750 / DSM 3376 / VPI C15-48 / C15-B4) TaxID=515620 RepID=C4Z673_LACE2|nr:Wzz/FepE/Etk N-terminal domain-containing protein [Lachnospira eligens]ACR73465.1 non-specific protein-tyrosine kinase [[Eubacterium] eligens ATCC 27750]UEA96332.1 protein-tyrosine kinase [Lachnospira eligens]
MQEKSKETENIEIDLREIFGVLIHRLWIIVVAALVCGSVAFMYSFFVITPQYESTTKVYILNKQNASGSVTYSDVQLSSTLSKDYEQLVTSRYVIEGVINDLKLDETYESLVKRVSASNATDTRIIAITVTDPEPEQAQKIANSVRDLAAKHITEVMDIEAVNVVDQANLPDEPVSPSIPKWTIIGVLVGIVISAAVIIIQHLLDDTIKTSEDIERYLGLSTLALIPVNEGQNSNQGKRRVPVPSKGGSKTDITMNDDKGRSFKASELENKKKSNGAKESVEE